MKFLVNFVWESENLKNVMYNKYQFLNLDDKAVFFI